jgi:hypothetical protein
MPLRVIRELSLRQRLPQGEGYFSKPVRPGFLRAEIDRLARPADGETRDSYTGGGRVYV